MLKAAPPGFEHIAILAEKLDGFVRLSSGWGFYDIWNSFLTDAIPPPHSQPLELLEKVNSIAGDTGKETFLKMWIQHCLCYPDIRSQAFLFVSLSTLPALLSGHETKMVRDLKGQFQKVRLIKHTPVFETEVPPSS